MNKKIIAGAGGILLAGMVVGSLMGGDEVATEPTTTVATTVATTTVPVTIPDPTTTYAVDLDAVELMALQSSVDMAQICPLINELRDAGVTDDAMVPFAISEFEDGFGQALRPASREWLEDQLRSC